jgi:hypothetical protein
VTWLGAAASAALLVAGVSVVCADYGRRPEASYADFAEAEKAGAMRRGWVPAWIPRSARTIRETHDLDTKQTMLSFRYAPGEMLAVPDSCIPVGSTELRGTPFSPSWWPRDVPPPRFVTHRHAYFACEAGRAFLAVSPNDGEGYYWRP